MCVEHAIQVVVGQRHPVPAHQVWIVDAPQKCGHFSESCNVRARSKEDARNLRGRVSELETRGEIASGRGREEPKVCSYPVGGPL